MRDEFIVHGEWTSADASARARELLGRKSPPTAIFATSDIQAAGVLMTAREMGVRVPEDLSVMGYDNLPISEFLSLTTMWQHHDQLARNACHLLLDELRTGTRAKERVVLQPELIVRSSTRHPRGKKA
jgi:DNA-binding LacI/PurR family transcriptional regulator